MAPHITHPEQPALYHGTIVEHLDEVLPARSTGQVTNHGASDPDFAYATVAEADAWNWALKARRAAGGGTPCVYAVAARGVVEHDGVWNDNGRKSRTGFVVIEQLPMPDDLVELARQPVAGQPGAA